MLKIAVFVLARGKYSKRIPYKPLTMLGGRCLIDYTLDICKDLPYETYVYTDMLEIENRCKNHASKPNIREKLFENEEGIHHTGKELAEYNKEVKADILILLQVTSPIRKINLIKNWVNIFLLSGADCGIATYRMNKGYYYTKYGAANFYNYDRCYNDNLNKLGTMYKETGSFYIFKKEQIEKNHFTNGDLILFDDPFDIDINTLDDIKRVEEVLKCVQN